MSICVEVGACSRTEHLNMKRSSEGMKEYDLSHFDHIHAILAITVVCSYHLIKATIFFFSILFVLPKAHKSPVIPKRVLINPMTWVTRWSCQVSVFHLVLPVHNESGTCGTQTTGWAKRHYAWVEGQARGRQSIPTYFLLS